MKNKLDEIAPLIVENLQNKMNNFSLLGGNLGEVIFLYYYSRVDKEYEEKADEALEKLLEKVSIDNGYFVSTYCNGFAGLGIALHLLEEEGFIEGSADVLEEVDLLLKYSLGQEIRNKNYDYLHGAVGIGFYFLKHSKYKPVKSKVQLQRILDYLADTAIEDPASKGLKWEDVDRNGENGEVKIRYNISLSHGMSSITIFLARLLALDILPEKESQIRQMLEKTLNYILAQQLDPQIYGAYFPSFSKESDKPIRGSRLAWCYGDLGIAIALWQAGKILQRKDCTQLSLEVLRYAAVYRRDLGTNYVYDAGMCHGTAGITQIFYRMYKETGLPELNEAYEYWKGQTLKMAYHVDGLAGYKMYNAKDAKWTHETSILEGIAGIGLLLLSSVTSDWDEILLLSFKK